MRFEYLEEKSKWGNHVYTTLYLLIENIEDKLEDDEKDENGARKCLTKFQA